MPAFLKIRHYSFFYVDKVDIIDIGGDMYRFPIRRKWLLPIMSRLSILSRCVFIVWKANAIQ